MNPLNPQDIAIERLRIRGDKRSAEDFARDLTYSGWSSPLPSQYQDAWIFVRELNLSGKPQQLRQQAAMTLDKALAEAVDGRNASASARVVRFASFPQLLAFLLRDIAQGQAASRWYWQRWAYLLRASREEGMAELLYDNLPFIPAIVQELVANGHLETVWLNLGSSTAQRMAAALARKQGMALTDFSRDQLLKAGTAPEVEAAYLHTNPSALQMFTRRPEQLRVWLRLLTPLAVTDGRVLLAALAFGLTHVPLLTLQEPAFVLRCFVSALVALIRSPVSKTLTDQKSAASLISPQLWRKAFINNEPLGSALLVEGFGCAAGFDKPETGPQLAVVWQQVQPKAAPQTSPVEGNETSVSSTSPAIAKPKIAAQLESISFDQVGNSVDQAEIAVDKFDAETQLETAEIKEEPANLPTQWLVTTQWGGLLYLINPLTRLFLNDEPNPEDALEFPKALSGWQWLFDVMRLVAALNPADAADFETDPLVTFFAQQLYSDDTAMEAREKLLGQAISPFAQQVFSAISKRYQEQGFWRELFVDETASPGLTATLFTRIPAKISASASHWDIYFPLNQVRLDIRLAAWDVNPDWVPWLGRVVTFHYLEGALT